MLTILIYYSSGFAICLTVAAVVWREKLRSWLSGLVGGTLAQVLGTRLAGPGILSWAQHWHVDDSSTMAGTTSAILGMVSAAAIIGILVYVMRRRKASKLPADTECA